MKLCPKIFKHAVRTYAQSQQLSNEVDKKLGLRVKEIELNLISLAKKELPYGNIHSWGKSLHDGAQSWVGLSTEQLQTTYDELIEIVEMLDPKENETWLDLGAGYSRLAFVLKAFAKNLNFIGYEIVKQRVEETNRVFKTFKMHSSIAITQDLTAKDFNLPVADTYFIYDYGKIEHIKHTLNQLSDIADAHRFNLVARGRVRDFIHYHHPWLCVKEPILKDSYNIYFC